MVKAALVVHEKRIVEGDEVIGIAELRIWSLPVSQTFPAGRKFSLFLVANGKVIVGIDNHAPKGPHAHIGEVERAYRFTTSEQLVEDFWAMVRKAGFRP